MKTKFRYLCAIDYITFSGRGDPLLAMNLGEAIRAVKQVRKERVAVLTNGSLIGDEDDRRDLSYADLVVVKLDACSRALLRRINRPAPGIGFDDIVSGIKKFRKDYKGRLALQMMFINDNKAHLAEYADLARSIGPDEIQINTPLRPSRVKPLSSDDIRIIKDNFLKACTGSDIVSVYDAREQIAVKSFSDEDTLRRRGKIA